MKIESYLYLLLLSKLGGRAITTDDITKNPGIELKNFNYWVNLNMELMSQLEFRNT